MIILGTNSIKDTGYNVANSCRFNDDDSAYMTKTPSGNGNRKVFTISLWVKRGNLGMQTNMIGSNDTGFGNGLFLEFQADDTLRFGFTDPNQLKATNRVFRDVSAWYHIVVAVDVTQASNSDRVKIYVNGTQETSFGTDNTMTDADKNWNNTQAHSVGRSGAYNGLYFDGYLAEVVSIDGSQLAATSFGEFDEDSPTIWKPKDVSGLTFGTNGFYLDFEDSANLGNDANGGTDFTENNLAATDQSIDTCTNNFATMNPLDNYYAASVFSEGNTTVDMNVSGNETYNTSTIGVSKGKWYAEVKLVDSSTKPMTGIVANHPVAIGTVLGNTGHGVAYMGEDGKYKTNSTNTTYGTTYTTNNIISIALDLDNNKLYFAKNNSWQNSGDPTSGSTGTGAISITAPSSTATGAYFFAAGKRHSDNNKVSWNFGSPPYSVSSGNADGNGYGNFEYAPPSGYLALCTKNLGSDGG